MAHHGRTRLFPVFDRFLADSGGNAAMIFALAVIPMFGAAGALADYGRAAGTRTLLQTTLDAAVLAGMKAAPGARAAAARDAFNARFPAGQAQITELTIAEPRNGEPLTASARATVATHFAGIFGQNGINIGATAQARFSDDSLGADARPRACLLLVDPNAPQALQVHSGADIVARRCQVHVRSTAAIVAHFAGQARLEAQRICLAGSGYLATGTNRLGPIETNCNAASDPFANAIPGPASLACDHTDRDFTSAGGSVTLNPGVYCGATRFTPGQTVTLEAGLYVLKGGAFRLQAGASLWGQNVSFHFADSAARFDLSGPVRLSLSAPRTGARRDVLMDEPEGLSRSSFELTADAPHALAGLIRLPSRNAVLRGEAAIDPERLTLVFNRLTIAGSTEMRLETSPRKIEVPDSKGAGPMIALSR